MFTVIKTCLSTSASEEEKEDLAIKHNTHSDSQAFLQNGFKRASKKKKKKKKETASSTS